MKVARLISGPVAVIVFWSMLGVILGKVAPELHDVFVVLPVYIGVIASLIYLWAKEE